MSQLIDSMLRGFDAENSQIDRRIYFEVTGKQVVESGEFLDGEDDSSDFEWANLNRADPLAHAFAYRESSYVVPESRASLIVAAEDNPL